MTDLTKLQAFCPQLTVYKSAVEQCIVDAVLCTDERVCDFLAQWAHETQGFTRTRENLNYSADGLTETFSRYFTAAQAANYARQPERIANHVYANRMGNGGEASGDGYRFRGRGWPMLTGKSNYAAASAFLFPDDPARLVEHPELVEQPPVAARVAAWFWREGNRTGKSLNRYVDRNDFTGLTEVVNGGDKGLADRLEWRAKAHATLRGT